MVSGTDGSGNIRESDHAAWKRRDLAIFNRFGVGDRVGMLAPRSNIKVRLVDRHGGM